MPRSQLRVRCWLLSVALCWFAFQCAALFRATVLALRERPIPTSSVPLGVYIYAFGDESCRNRLTLEGSARLRPETKPRVAPLVEFVAWRVPSASLPFHAVVLPRLSLAIRVVMPCRRDTGSLPHSRLSAQSANRIPACHSALRSATLPASSLHVKPLQAAATATN